MTARCAVCVLVLWGAFSCRAQAPLRGAGATFPAPIYQKWLQSFQSANPGLPITYDPVGSEAGIEKIARREVDFAASDYPPPREMQQKLGVRLFATVLGGAVPAYNIPNLKRELRFPPKLLADIYLGKITRWDAPEIKALNRDANLPSEPIIVVYRSDGSGTSYVWTDFLSTTSPEWRSRVGAGTRPNWPVGRGAEGNEGVADLISRTPFSLGYVEYLYALRSRLGYGAVKNAAGSFVQASIDTLTAAGGAAQGNIQQGISIVNAPGREAYPIASFTWLLVRMKMESPDKRERLRAFLEWALSQGQAQAASLGYIAVPEELAARQRNIAAQLWMNQDTRE